MFTLSKMFILGSITNNLFVIGQLFWGFMPGTY